MSDKLDMGLSGLSLIEEDEPFILPDLPEYCSNVRNRLSLMGRLLNPQCQNMADVILDMPRKWQLYDRVKGVALSKDRFQFIFKYEHDLDDILARGVHTCNQWSIATERWVPKPPPEYLQFLELWVRIRNIPVNYRTGPSISAMAEFAGPVVEVTFDPDKPQTNIYERAKIRFDIDKPLLLAKKVQFPNGEVANILYDYERIQKRCHSCQRLTHEKGQCPFVRTRRAEGETKGTSSEATAESSKELIIKENDPLYGVVKESQVGINPMTGRPKIVPEVLADLRQYLEVANGPEKIARKERVKKTLVELESDPMGQKMMLRLEPLPVFTPILDKGKGIVFDYRLHEELSLQGKDNQKDKVMESAVRAGQAMSLLPLDGSIQSEDNARSGFFVDDTFSAGSTGFRTGFCETSSSGTKLRKARIRRRPGTFRRKPRVDPHDTATMDKHQARSGKEIVGEKRKLKEDVETSQYSRRPKKPLVVPKEGPPQC